MAIGLSSFSCLRARSSSWQPRRRVVKRRDVVRNDFAVVGGLRRIKESSEEDFVIEKWTGLAFHCVLVSVVDVLGSRRVSLTGVFC